MKRLDLTGSTFGRLKVESFAYTRENQAYWNCKCSCGGTLVVSRGNLKTGNTKSCGCLFRDRMKEVFTKIWDPIDKGSYFEVPLTKGLFAKIDKEDLKLVEGHKWVLKSLSNRYAIARDKETGKQLRMHRVILGVDNPKISIDHINHDSLDNRRVNLRVCSHHQNCSNKRTYKKSNTGIRGVYYRKDIDSFSASITYKKKHIHLGYFKNVEDAERARKKAEEKYFGEFKYNER